MTVIIHPRDPQASHASSTEAMPIGGEHGSIPVILRWKSWPCYLDGGNEKTNEKKLGSLIGPKDESIKPIFEPQQQ